MVAVSPAFRAALLEVIEIVGATVSITIGNATDVATLPARSVTEAISEYKPSTSVETGIVHRPALSAVALPTSVAPFLRVTTASASEVPLTVGVTSFEAPPLETLVMTGLTSSLTVAMTGVCGGMTSTTIR